MSGGSQHNPNGRQSQLGSGWSPLQLQVANLLARVPQAHMASDRGVTWHTPTPPPHLYHVPAPSPPDPLQAMKSAGNSVFRHTATPPDLYRHTPTPPDKHIMRHTPSPGDVKLGAPLPTELFPHLPGRDKVRAEAELYPRGGVDLSVRGANGSPAPPPAPAAPAPSAPALSVRDAPTINSLIARAAPHGRAVHARVDALLERLSAPASPHSVIVHPRHHTPSPPSENEDSADSCGAPPGSKRKRKPERTIRVPVAAPERAPSPPPPPAENGDVHPPPAAPQPPHPPSPQRRARSGSAETIDDIAAMIAGTEPAPAPPAPPEPDAPAIDKLESVLASPEPPAPESPEKPPESAEPPPSAAAPRRRSARTSNADSTNVPVESPSEAKPAEPEASEARSAEPVAASLNEVEKQLKHMFAGIDDAPVAPPAASEPDTRRTETEQTAKARKRRKSAPTKGERKASKRTSRASTGDEASRRKVVRKKGADKKKKDGAVKDAYAYDSGSNASSSRSRGPYIQIVGPRDSPVSVAVVNAAAGEDDRRTGDEWRNGLRARGLHASTLGLRYDASTPDASWLCAFCERGPHYSGLGDLFGPYALDTECEEYRSLDEASKRRFASSSGGAEVWFHEACGVWAPGLLAAGARIWGLAPAVCNARGVRCATCARAGAALSCATRACPTAAHYPCATAWTLRDDFRALCPRHAKTQ